MSDPTVKVIVEVPPAGIDQVKGLSDQVKQLSGALEGTKEPSHHAAAGLGEVHEHGEEAAHGGLASVIEALEGMKHGMTNAEGGIFGFLNNLGELSEGLVALATAFAGFEVFKLFAELSMEGAKAQALTDGLRSVGEAAGYSGERMDEAREHLEKLGMSTAGATRDLQNLLSNGLGPEASEKMADAARILAIKTGQEIDKVYAQLTNAVSRGNTMMLQRTMHLTVDQKKAQEEAIHENGGKDLSESQSKTATMEAVTSAITDKYGTEAVDTTIKKVQDLSRAWELLKETIGMSGQSVFGEIVGAAGEAVKGITEFINSLKELPDWLDENQGKLITLGVVAALAFTPAIVSATGAVLAFIPRLVILALEFAATAREAAATWLAIGGPFALVAAAAFFMFTDRGQAALAYLGLALQLATLNVQKFFSSGTDAELLASQIDKIKEKMGEVGKVVIHGEQEYAVPKQGEHNAKNAGEGGDHAGPETDADRTRKAAAGEAAAKAASQKRLDLVKDEQSRLKDIWANQEKDDKQRYDRGLMSFEDYWAARKTRAQAAADEAVKVAKAELASTLEANAQKAAAEIRKPEASRNIAAVGSANSASAFAAQLKVDEAKRKASEATLDITRQEDDARYKSLSTAEKMYSAYAKTIGDTVGAALADQDEAYKQQSIQINGIADNDLRKERQSQLDIEDSLKRQNIVLDAQAKLRDTLSATAMKELDLQKAKLDTAHSRGVVTDLQFQAASNQLILNRIKANEDLLVSEQKRLELMKLLRADPLVIEGQEQKVLGLKTTIEQLSGSMVQLGDDIKKAFTDSLGTALQDLSKGITNVGDAMKSVLKSVVDNMLKTTTTNFAQSLTGMITNATGGGNGIFGQMAAMTGMVTGNDGKTAATAMFVQNVPTAASLVNDPTVKASAMIDTIKDKFSSVTDSVGKGFMDVVDWLGPALSSMIASIQGAGAAGSSGGSIVSGIASFFGFADGGLIGGNGGPTEDNIPIMASSGEHITNAAQTKKWLPLLTAINTGAIDSMGIGGQHGLQKFATGGLVGGGSTPNPSGAGLAGGSQVNNITITIDGNNNANSSAAGSGSQGAASFGKSISAMVVNELVKQKRPGGLLAA